MRETGSVSPYVRLALEAGPLLVFFLANAKSGIMVGTAAFMMATALALAVSWWRERRVPVMPLVTAVFVLLFGGLTLWLDDALFIKLKPTVVNLLFATVLAAGLVTGRPVLQHVFGTVFSLTAEGWTRMSRRWMLFFVLLAVLNEVVWRTQSTDAWVSFKVFGILPLTLVFSVLQVPLILKYTQPAPEEETPATADADA